MTQNNMLSRLFNSIQSQLIISFLLLGLLPLTIMGGVAWLNSTNALEEAAYDEATAIAAAKATRIEDFLLDAQRMTLSLASLPAFYGDNQDVIGGENATYIGLEDIQSLISQTSSVGYISAYNTAISAAQVYVDSFTRIDAVVAIGTNNRVLVSTDESIRLNSTVNSVDWIQITEGISGATHSDIQVDGTGNEFMTVTAPVTNYTNDLVGYIAMRINLNRMIEVLGDNTGLGQTGETYLVDMENYLLISESRFDANAIFNQTIDTFAVNQAIAGVESGVGTYDDYRFSSVIGSWRTVEGTDWVLLTEQDYSEAMASTNELTTIILLVVGIAAAIIVVISYLIARSISKPITLVAEAAQNLADGDLEQRVNIRSSNETGVLADAFNVMANNLQTMVIAERDSKEELERTVYEYSEFIENVAGGNLTQTLQLNHTTSSDELGRLGYNLNGMVENLRGMAGQINETAVGVSAAAAEILAATTQQIASATEQEAAVTQTMTTVEEVRTTVKQTSERAQNVADVSKESVEVSADGQETVADTVEGMKVIQGRVESIAENILMLSERTQQIGEIIETVNEIAAQSKLLALNASIEAARAGEEGKGFAVVAMEVRELAEQSREATERVRDILNQIQQATNTAVMVTEEGSKGAESGMELVERAGKSIEALTRTIEQASQAAVQIAASTNQQNNGMEQLAQAMSAIKQASTQTAASTRQAERSAKDLNDMAQQMQEAVSRYRLN